MASEVDVVDALQECAEAWEPDVCVLGNVQARDVVAVCERLRAAEAERDEDRRGFDERSQALAKEIERAEQAEKERDQARERESYALAAIERNDEVHAEAIRAVRQRAERAEQTRDAHSDALAQAARDAGDLLDRIAALTVERDEARAALIRSQEDHRAAVEALETYEERIGDIADHVLGLVPPDVPSIVKLDAIERRCGEERVAARQAERERDEARAALDAAWKAAAMPVRGMVDLAEVVGTLRTTRDEYRAAAEVDQRERAISDSLENIAREDLRAAVARAEAAEARVAELEDADKAWALVEQAHGVDARTAVTQHAVLERIADAAASAREHLSSALDRLASRGPANAVVIERIGDDVDAAYCDLNAALAARGKDTP